ncbi:MAG TPA: ribosomal RNA small subunit methyltransferase A, partial [Candidatus Handelsmanbacteria bacterium]|nr:ribosomal RNA small subunit methyltransferase A [Candidatus Handelsmanbacteria bacterium]
MLTDIAARVEPTPEDLVLEIGPGRGALTAPLRQRVEGLVAIEIDRDLCAHLRQRFADPPLRVLEGDVLRLDLQQLLEEEGRSTLFVVSNLPYNITAPVLFRLREHAGLVRRAVLTVQKEVAERLVSESGNRAYSQLTVFLGQCARIRLARLIPSTAFKPQPKVDSAVIDVEFLPNHVPVDDMRVFELVVKVAFSQRRKMLRNALKSLPFAEAGGTIASQDLERMAEAADIDLTHRAEDLSIGPRGGKTDGMIRWTVVCVLLCVTAVCGENYSLSFSRRSERLTWRPVFPGWNFSTPVTLSAAGDSTSMLRLNASMSMNAILDQRNGRNNWTENASIRTSVQYPILGPRASVGITANMTSRNASLLNQKTRSQTI